ncbi:MAG: 16S rRNA (guanine(527)-N(7))-methyltransferase RsmG [Deltaproteobacteria bacterium]
MNNEYILKYFPDLDKYQLQQFQLIWSLYTEWNSKINLISRNDIENLFLHHILHSLAILKFYKFRSGAKILDLGTGGGFPGIPLALMLPDVNFTLIDGTSKKIKVVHDVSDKLELKNVKALHIRAEEFKEKFDFVVTRAVASIDVLQNWCIPLLKVASVGEMPSGIFAYKGGDYRTELKKIKKTNYIEINNIYDVFPEEYFKEKVIIYLQR